MDRSSLQANDVYELDTAGFTVLRSILDARMASLLTAAFEAALAPASEMATPSQTGTRHVEDPLGRDPAFVVVAKEPRVLAAVHHVLDGPFRISQAGGRDPSPGHGQQGLHTDWRPRSQGEPSRVVTTLWLLDDFTPTNGATRVVPGSHKIHSPLPKHFADPAAHHPQEILVQASAGDVVVFNGHLWHSGTRNCSAAHRRVLQVTFQSQAIPLLTPCTKARPDTLPTAIRALLGI